MSVVSWGFCAEIVAGLTIAYYSLVGILYYRPQGTRLLKRMFHRNVVQSKPIATDNRPPKEEISASGNTADSSDISSMLLRCADEITALCGELANEAVDALIWQQSIRRVLRKYPALKESAYRQTITDLIDHETRKNPSIGTQPERPIDWWG